MTCRSAQEPQMSPSTAQAGTTTSDAIAGSAETAAALQQVSQEGVQTEQGEAGSSRGVPRRSVSHGDASGYAASPKCW